MADEIDLVGRDKELRALRAALERAADGRGRLVVVSGEPGIGKSALTAVLAREAQARGARVVFGRAWELAEAPPYFPLLACLASLGIAAPEREGDTFPLWERVLEALARTSDALVVWILEDVHAADLGTLDLLTLLAQPLGALRALVVATTRAQDPRITDRVEQRLTRMMRDGLEVRLAPLTAADVAVLAEQITGRALPAFAAAELASRTGGNPLFVAECARAHVAMGAAPRSVHALPHTVRQVVLERIDLLPESTRQILTAAAIVGREAGAATVGRMLDLLPARVIDALVPAIRAGIVVETRPGRFAFTHILVRDAVEDAIAPAARADLHARACAALTGDGADVLVERARHALAAMADERAAIDLGARAARLLEEQGAFDRAYAMHLRIDAARARFGHPAGPEERLHSARIAQGAGRYAEARQACEEIVAHARAIGAPELLARAALAMGAELRPAMIDRGLVVALEEARRILPPSASGLACRVDARLAAAMQPALDPSVPVAMARGAIARARALGDEAVLLEVLHVASAALVDYAPANERLAIETETLDLALAAEDLPKAVRALARLGIDHAEAGAIDAWSHAVDRALDVSLRLGHPRDRWRPLLLASMRAVARGDVEDAERWLVEVHHFASITDDAALALSLGAHAVGVARLLHRDDAMRARTPLEEAAREVPHGMVVEAIIRAALLARLEDPEGTRALLAQLGDRGARYESGVFGAWMAEAHAFAGNTAVCLRLRDKLALEESRHLTSGHVAMTYEGPMCRVLALLDMALGDVAVAEARMRAALAVVTACRLRPWIAQCSYNLGNVLASAGRGGEAAPLFAEAASIASDVGMPGLVARAAAKAGRVLVPAAPIPSVSTAPRFTMERDGDVWRIAYGGRELRVKDSRGMVLLARLVERPEEEVHVLALASDDDGASLFDAASEGAVDARARRAYKARLDNLEEALADAERDCDVGRVEKARREKAMLETELARAFGLGGKARAAGSPAERARVNVQRRLKDAIARIGELDSAAGRFLQKAVRTGTYCSFVT